MELVAKSYVGLPQLGNAYEVSGKMYVKVQMANGTVKQVRAYNQTEYKKYYPELAKQSQDSDPYYKSQKVVLGFIDNYITIFKGDTYPHKEWFKSIGAVYRKWWGWGLASNVELPAELPTDIEAVRLDWDVVGTEAEVLKPEDQLKAAVESVMYEASESEYVGEVGETLELYLTVQKAIEMEGYYGTSTCHIMTDDCGNEYVWTTAARHWEEGSEHHIKGKVKDHKMYRNSKQTILTRCKAVE